MKNRVAAKVLRACLIGLLPIVVIGCFYSGGWAKAKHQKTIMLRSPLEADSIIVAEASFGSITVIAAEVSDCNVIAEICVQAPTKEEAREIAERIKIELKKTGKTLIVKADKPCVKNNRSISISYRITAPKQTSVECSSAYGSIQIIGIEGYAKAHTSYGSIKCVETMGKISLDTAYGGIDCRSIAADELNVSSSYGSMNIEYSDSVSAKIQANVTTAYGSIDFTTPADFAGEVELATSFGSVNTELPITVKGEINSKRIRGSIGEGDGKLSLTTSFGSIRLK